MYRNKSISMSRVYILEFYPECQPWNYIAWDYRQSNWRKQNTLRVLYTNSRPADIKTKGLGIRLLSTTVSWGQGAIDAKPLGPTVWCYRTIYRGESPKWRAWRGSWYRFSLSLYNQTPFYSSSLHIESIYKCPPPRLEGHSPVHLHIYI